MDTQRKGEWCISLQSFLSSRLRTPSFAVASRQHPFVSVPSMIPRTQFLLDGVVGAINDHPSWVLDAWLTVQNCIKDTGTRFAELSEELYRAVTLSSTSNAAPSRTAMAAPRGSALDRERTYRAHAAVQDIYLAFCVMDALIKNVCAEAAATLHAAVETELPHLVADFVPIFAPATSYWIEDAVEEYRYLFHALLDSWVVQNTVNSDVHRRLQEYLQDRLQRTREVEEKAELAGSESAEGTTNRSANPAQTTSSGNNSGAAAGTGTGSSSSNGNSNTNVANPWQKSMQHIIESTARISAAVVAASSAPTNKPHGRNAPGGAPAAKNSGQRGFDRGARTPEAVERTLQSFLSYVFPPRRTVAVRHCCPHCGALFRDDKSKKAHYRCHFYARNYLKRDEKLVRLMYPSAGDFAEHTGDLRREGFFTRTVEVLEEAYKGGERGAVKIRKLEEPATDSAEGAS